MTIDRSSAATALGLVPSLFQSESRSCPCPRSKTSINGVSDLFLQKGGKCCCITFDFTSFPALPQYHHRLFQAFQPGLQAFIAGEVGIFGPCIYIGVLLPFRLGGFPCACMKGGGWHYVCAKQTMRRSRSLSYLSV